MESRVKVLVAWIQDLPGHRHEHLQGTFTRMEDGKRVTRWKTAAAGRYVPDLCRAWAAVLQGARPLAGLSGCVWRDACCLAEMVYDGLWRHRLSSYSPPCLSIAVFRRPCVVWFIHSDWLGRMSGGCNCYFFGGGWEDAASTWGSKSTSTSSGGGESSRKKRPAGDAVRVMKRPAGKPQGL